MALKNYIFGVERDLIPNIAFNMMASVIRLREGLFKFSRQLEQFGIQDGDIVVDYGCGPGMYLTKAAELVGDTGAVYAVDIHPQAIQAAGALIQKRALSNVKAVLAHGYRSPIHTNAADLIYALDMFHMIKDPDALLNEFHRLLKPTGVLIIDDGHQPRSETRRKISSSRLWALQKERQSFIKYTPIH